MYNKFFLYLSILYLLFSCLFLTSNIFLDLKKQTDQVIDQSTVFIKQIFKKINFLVINFYILLRIQLFNQYQFLILLKKRKQNDNYAQFLFACTETIEGLQKLQRMFFNIGSSNANHLSCENTLTTEIVKQMFQVMMLNH